LNQRLSILRIQKTGVVSKLTGKRAGLMENGACSIDFSRQQSNSLDHENCVLSNPPAKVRFRPQIGRALKLEDLVDMDNPRAVFTEVFRIVSLMHPGLDLTPLKTACEQMLHLFRGEFFGYRECNIFYHDLKHTTDCLLAMARLLHGAFLRGLNISPNNILLGLISALLHDTGYIQKNDEASGTGAQFTLTHIDRSIEFLEIYTKRYKIPGMNLQAARTCLKCTGPDERIDLLPFEEDEHEILGKALAAADLLGQMADRTYLERLPLLYREFREGKVPGFENEFDLIKKSPEFWEFVKDRLANALSGVDSLMIDHFRARWAIDSDLYRVAIEGNMRYLKFLIHYHGGDYRQFLRRGNIMEKLAQMEETENFETAAARASAS
jgi:hypothetical protein